MTSSRKRKRKTSVNAIVSEGPSRKKVHDIPKEGKLTLSEQIKHDILGQYFSGVLTLRDYVLLKLPDSSRIRRKRIASIGGEGFAETVVTAVELSVGALLDLTLVGLSGKAKPISDNRWEQWSNFSQKGDDSYITLSDGLAGAAFSQSEIVDFVIWLLFSKSKASGTWPKHLLCDGFRRDPNFAGHQLPVGNQQPTIPGIFSLYPNPQVEALKQAPWPQLLKLIGKCGDRIMMDLLVDCAVFVSVKAGQGNYCQISGYPLSDTEALIPDSLQDKQSKDFERSPTEITFVRNRMLYARAALNARGLVQFGLRHIHILNRAPYIQSDQSTNPDFDDVAVKNKVNTLRVMMYMFPRQFGLHNAFTSKIDFTETAQRLKDYTLRDQEISGKFGRLGGDARLPKTPKRLRGEAKDLVQKLQILHARCAYSKLLQHYCPVAASIDSRGSSQLTRNKTKRSSLNVDDRVTQAIPQLQSPAESTKSAQTSSIIDLATPPAQVSGFCRAVVSKILPDEFFGYGDVQKNNKSVILKRIDRFILLRRFEGMSLHEVMQQMEITDIAWLAPPQLMIHKTSQTDIRKRAELFYEFLYYIFDSILIPLLRSNFYVTESNTDKYRLFYFRHDVWRYVAEPAMGSLKVKMFEEVSLVDANRILDSRQLGFSQIRLLPKGMTVRPIMNLRKKMVTRGSKKVLGPSINTMLKPVHNILQLEKSINPEKLGSTLFSVGDIYKRIRSFKSQMGSSTKPFYFAKVDVQSAFDTIPQSAIVGLLDSIPQQHEYHIAKHVEITNSKLGIPQSRIKASKSNKTLRKWHSTAMKNKNLPTFLQSLEENLAITKRNTVFIESVVKKRYETSSMLQLVASHIQQNLVKVGKKYYRQKEGIPQGSVLSSTLCNYFYADLEIHVLKFINSEDCLLLRLIDDFLLITTDKQKASRFVETMHSGIPEYGVLINPAKTLVNFDVTVNHKPVPRVGASHGIPYCGTMINPQTLDITRDRERSMPKSIYNSLTVEYTRVPGQTFQRKVLDAFKIQSHLMYFDTSLNSASTMLLNLHAAFQETATKMWAYARCLPRAKQPAPGLVIRTVEKLADVAFLLATSKARKLKYPGYVCDVRKTEVRWLAYRAFLDVLGNKQSNYSKVLGWLQSEMRKLGAMKEIRRGRVGHVNGI